MADTPETRQKTVEDHIDLLVATYGEDAFRRLAIEMLKDISVSVAIIADNTTPTT